MNNDTADAAASFLVLVFPPDSSKATLTDLARRLATALRQASGDTPTPVRPNLSALCLLVHGRFRAIKDAMDDVMDAYTPWLVVHAGTPFAAHGLSTAEHWLRRRS